MSSSNITTKQIQKHLPSYSNKQYVVLESCTCIHAPAGSLSLTSTQESPAGR